MNVTTATHYDKKYDEMDFMMFPDNSKDFILRVHWQYYITTIYFKKKININVRSYIKDTLRFEKAININNQKPGWVLEQFSSLEELKTKCPNTLTEEINVSSNCVGYALGLPYWIDASAVTNLFRSTANFVEIEEPVPDSILAFYNNAEVVHVAKHLGNNIYESKNGFRDVHKANGLAAASADYYGQYNTTKHLFPVPDLIDPWKLQSPL